jgi:hypothetical protein
MNFEIDTGLSAHPQTAVDFVADWMRDQCPQSYEDWQIVQAYAHHIIGDMSRPKKPETVINHLLFDWRFIGALGRENPQLFKEIWTAFAERVDGQ